MPASALHVFEWYLELAAGRQFDSAIAWSDLRAWALMTGARPRGWEIKAIFALDRTHMNYKPETAPDGAPLVDASAHNLKEMLRGLGSKPATAPAPKAKL